MSHRCAGNLPESFDGGLILTCDEDELGNLWAWRGREGSVVNFCPFCGYKAAKQVKPGADADGRWKEKS